MAATSSSHRPRPVWPSAADSSASVGACAEPMNALGLLFVVILLVWLVGFGLLAFHIDLRNPEMPAEFLQLFCRQRTRNIHHGQLPRRRVHQHQPADFVGAG